MAVRRSLGNDMEPQSLAWLLGGFAAGLVVALVFVAVLAIFGPDADGSDEPATVDAGHDNSGQSVVDEDSTSPDVVAQAKRIEDDLEQLPHPQNILDHPGFQRIVEGLSDADSSTEALGKLAFGSNWILSCAALEALTQRGDVESLVKRAIDRCGRAYGWQLFFLVRMIESASSGDNAAAVLAYADDWWASTDYIIELMAALRNDDFAQAIPSPWLLSCLTGRMLMSVHWRR